MGAKNAGRPARHSRSKVDRAYYSRGKHESHIFDPRTGEQAGNVVCAPVISERAADANALATILNLLPIEEGLRLVASLPGFD